MPNILVLDRDAVVKALDSEDLLTAMAAAHRDLSAEPDLMPLKIGAAVPASSGMLVVMPANVPSMGVVGAKLMSAFGDNPRRGLPYTQGLIVLFSAEAGVPLAVIDGTYITEMRTAAGSALATQLLAVHRPSVLAILGTGRQARAHAQLLAKTVQIAEGRVAGRDYERATALARAITTDLGIEFRAVRTYEDAVVGAHIVCCTTHSPDPIIERSWLSPGTHINSVGLNRSGREIGPEVVRDSVLVVEHRASVLSKTAAGSNDINWAIRDGFITESHIRAELGQLLVSPERGRTSPEEITLYKSVGVAVQDVAVAHSVVERARDLGIGIEVNV
jgi:ornithine cyclodeaminase